MMVDEAQNELRRRSGGGIHVADDAQTVAVTMKMNVRDR
jgi:hypothetical protein